MADNTGDAVFVAFDLDMAKLTNIPAAEAAEVIVGCPLTHLELQYNLSPVYFQWLSVHHSQTLWAM